MVSSMALLFLLAVAFTSTVTLANSTDTIAPDNTTVCNSMLQTWWHVTGEINTKTQVQLGNVRQSHAYAASVKSTTDSSNTYYHSFVYESIPRNGQGNILIPGHLESTTVNDDGITIEETVGITMAWTSFLYGADAWVKVSRPGGKAANATNVVIRPTNLNLTVTDDGAGNVDILVPYRTQGIRFSVEFQDALYTYYDSCTSPICDYVQTLDPAARGYVNVLGTAHPVMGVEPQDALLIFASPLPTPDLVPDRNSSHTYIVYPGQVPDLRQVANTIVWFEPGVHYMNATTHALLSESVAWVYLSPGAYVKGAFQYQTSNTTIKATGHGVVSGELYVYQANTADGYKNEKSNEDSLRIWSGYSTPSVEQTFVLNGLVTNAPPFNSIDFTGDINTISINQSDYKQVGAFFGQTDGTTLYPGSIVRDTFYHSGDDTIKTYGSHIFVSGVTVWKTKVAPIIQLGWAARNLTNITVELVDVIHMRYSSNGSHPSIIGANQIYTYTEASTNTANLSMSISNIEFRNIRGEGISGNLMRICPLANYENVTIANVELEQFSVTTNGIYRSEMPVFTDNSGKRVSISNFTISNYTVGGVKISMAANNYGANQLGGLHIAPEFLQDGGVTIV